MIKYFPQRICASSPLILIKRIAQIVGKKVQLLLTEFRDKKRSSYEKYVPLKSGSAVRPFSFINSNILQSHYKVIEYNGGYYREHVFDLLGSGPIRIKHGIICEGLQKCKYDRAIDIEPDSKAEGMTGIINSSNLKESGRIRRLFVSPQTSPLKAHAYIPIDWQLDFKSGYRWSEDTWYKKIPYAFKGNKPGVDIKVPWELARFQHMTTLAMGYVTTKERDHAKEAQDKYIYEFRNQILDFIAANPPRFGVNWACSMEVGIRAANWLVAFDLFKTHGAVFDEEFMPIFNRSIFEHGRHIRNNLEFSEDLTSNHYLSNIVGLLFAASYLPRSEKTAEWLKFAFNELKNEMEKQVYHDGTDFEASTCYHRLVLEIFFYSAYLIIKKDKDFNGVNYQDVCKKTLGNNYSKKLYTMFDAVFYLLKPNGRMPQVGDNDSGQFLRLYPREIADMRYLLALGSVFFKEGRWKVDAFFRNDEDIAEVGILYGESGIQTWKSLTSNSLGNIQSKGFQDSGWYVMRDHRNYLIISCGPNGQNNFGGHAHNDKLSIELNMNGEDLIVDPGTYLYTPDPTSRNLFRSTSYHNTVVIDGEEQNRFIDRSLFLLNNDTKAGRLKWQPEERRDIFIGEHHGYTRLKNNVVHKREILFDKLKQEIKIQDHFHGKGEHLYEWYFHFAPGINVLLTGENEILLTSGKGMKAALCPVRGEVDLDVEITEGWVSSEYGIKEKSAICRYYFEGECNFKVNFKVRMSDA